LSNSLDMEKFDHGRGVRLDQVSHGRVFRGTPLEGWYKDLKVRLSSQSNVLAATTAELQAAADRALPLALLFTSGGAFVDLALVSFDELVPSSAFTTSYGPWVYGHGGGVSGGVNSAGGSEEPSTPPMLGVGGGRLRVLAPSVLSQSVHGAGGLAGSQVLWRAMELVVRKSRGLAGKSLVLSDAGLLKILKKATKEVLSVAAPEIVTLRVAEQSLPIEHPNSPGAMETRVRGPPAEATAYAAIRRYPLWAWGGSARERTST